MFRLFNTKKIINEGKYKNKKNHNKNDKLYRYIISRLNENSDKIVIAKRNSFCGLDDIYDLDLTLYSYEDFLSIQQKLFRYMYENNIIRFITVHHTRWNVNGIVENSLDTITIETPTKLFSLLYESEKSCTSLDNFLCEISKHSYFCNLNEIFEDLLSFSSYKGILDDLKNNNIVIDNSILNKKQNHFAFMKKFCNCVKFTNKLNLNTSTGLGLNEYFLTCDYDILREKLSNLYNYNIYLLNYVIDALCTNDMHFDGYTTMFEDDFLIEKFPTIITNKKLLKLYCFHNYSIVNKCITQLSEPEQIPFCIDLIEMNTKLYGYFNEDFQKNKNVWKATLLKNLEKPNLSMNYIIKHSDCDINQWRLFIESL